MTDQFQTQLTGIIGKYQFRIDSHVHNNVFKATIWSVDKSITEDNITKLFDGDILELTNTLVQRLGSFPEINFNDPIIWLR